MKSTMTIGGSGTNQRVGRLDSLCRDGADACRDVHNMTKLPNSQSRKSFKVFHHATEVLIYLLVHLKYYLVTNPTPLDPANACIFCCTCANWMQEKK